MNEFNLGCGHSIKKCKVCGEIVQQCRCMSHNKPIEYVVCVK